MLPFMTASQFNSNVHSSECGYLNYVPLKLGIFLFIESCPWLRTQTHLTTKPWTFLASSQPSPGRIAPNPVLRDANSQTPGNFPDLHLAWVPLPLTPSNLGWDDVLVPPLCCNQAWPVRRQLPPARFSSSLTDACVLDHHGSDGVNKGHKGHCAASWVFLDKNKFTKLQNLSETILS